MEDDDHAGQQDQLEEHSLPGTNQAGKGPDSCEGNGEENEPGTGRGAASAPAQGTQPLRHQRRREGV